MQGPSSKPDLNRSNPKSVHSMKTMSNKMTQSLQDGLILSGYQKKLKTMKKKFFVLYKSTVGKAARLEYYDNERKFKAGSLPKRVIELENCFNINRRFDTKHEFVIALSTKDSGFGIVLESKEEMNEWLEKLIALQRGSTSEPLRPKYDHVWEVKIRRQGIADEKGLIGNYYVCLSSKSVTFLRIGSERTTFGDARLHTVEIALTTIRRCGDTQCLFYMEVGRQSSIGPGELWMETEDTLIAKNMHSMILSAMSVKTDVKEPMRTRSSSVNEVSKPINVTHRNKTQPDNQILNASPQTIFSTKLYGRERCDSLPSRNRTSSESNNKNMPSTLSQSARNNTMSTLLPICHRHSNSPPMNSTIACSESEESSLSIDDLDDNTNFPSYRFNSRPAEGVIFEENTDDLNSENKFSDSIERNSHWSGSLKLLDNEGETYVSMAPVSVADIADDKLKNLKYINASDNSENSPVHYNSSNQNSSLKPNLEFSECSMDNTCLSANTEKDALCDRPARCYSIGSRGEHSNYKRINIDSLDQNNQQQRVRAFSVGSRAKIPRCDLQRGVLFSKSIEQNCNSSNNNISATEVLPIQLLNAATIGNRDKKSTSAPILIHKSHNSVDRMSDLMEIDFSKGPTLPSNIKYLQQYSNSTTQKLHPLSKSVPSNTRDSLMKRTESYLNRGINSIQNNFTQMTLKPSNQTNDNGYLEMKPVGNISVTSTNPKTSINTSELTKGNFEPFSNKFNSSDINTDLGGKTSSVEKVKNQITTPQITALNNVDSSSSSISNRDNSKQNQSKCVKDYKPKSIDSCRQEPPINILSKYMYNNIVNKSENKSINVDKESCKVNKLKFSGLNSTFKTTANDEIVTDDYVNIDKNLLRMDNTQKVINMCNNGNVKNRKQQCNNFVQDNMKTLAESIKDVNYKSDTNESQNSMLNSNETGYEILHIKSDSSLQSHKLSNRSSGRVDHKQQSQYIRPRSTNSSTPLKTPASTTSLCSSCTSSSTSCLSHLATTPYPLSTIVDARSTTNAENNLAQLSTMISSKHLNIISRPTSVSSEQELHYADLDLKQCNTNLGTKLPTEITSASECLTPCTGTVYNNSYAKIDFDHSDSSSSTSSRNCN